MKKTKLIIMALAALMLVPFASYARERVKPTDFNTCKIRDLALIWVGNQRHLKWTVDEYEPYVAHTFADGRREWTFDGFLFLEGDNGEGVSFIPSLGKMGTKKEWQWYIDKLFERDRALDALDKCIEKTKAELGDPGFKHQVVISILTPCLKTIDWGELDGKPVDMSQYDQAALAAKWYIDTVVETFKKQNYKNIELTGLYWLDEDLCHTFELASYVEPYVHAHDMDYYWIPYFNARGTGLWRDMGFDMVYIQPNYLFVDETILRLKDAVDYAKGLETGLELEMEDTSVSAVTPPEKCTQQKFKDYLDYFKERGVWDRAGIAYYLGTKAVLTAAEKGNETDKALMDQMFNYIVERRHNPYLLKN